MDAVRAYQFLLSCIIPSKMFHSTCTYESGLSKTPAETQGKMWICRNSMNNRIFWVLQGPLVKCLIRKSGVLGLSPTGYVFGQDTSEPQPSTSQIQERH